MKQVFFDQYSKKEVIIVALLAVAYLAWSGLVIGFRNDHFLLAGILLTAYFAHPVSKKILLSVFFFILYWIVYDATRVYPNFEFNPVHIQEPYEIEKALFGIMTADGVVTPNEYFLTHTHPILDFFAGIFYLSWVPVPMLFGVWLFFKDKKLLLQFSVCFLLVNIFGFVIYYLYPAAPPWYVVLHGFEENFSIPGNEAGLSRFDELLGIQLFHNMYARNANVFAAIPSMHSAFPILALYYAVKKGARFWIGLFVVVGLGIWFSAVYTIHHYVIDVLLGISCSVVAIVALEFLRRKTIVKTWLEKYEAVISTEAPDVSALSDEKTPSPQTEEISA